MNPLQWLAWSLAWPYYLAASTWAGLLEALVESVDTDRQSCRSGTTIKTNHRKDSQ